MQFVLCALVTTIDDGCDSKPFTSFQRWNIHLFRLYRGVWFKMFTLSFHGREKNACCCCFSCFHRILFTSYFNFVVDFDKILWKSDLLWLHFSFFFCMLSCICHLYIDSCDNKWSHLEKLYAYVLIETETNCKTGKQKRSHSKSTWAKKSCDFVETAQFTLCKDMYTIYTCINIVTVKSIDIPYRHYNWA